MKISQNIKKTSYTALLMVLLLFLSACETRIINSSEQAQNTISVQGQATVSASPDEAKINLRIETHGDTANFAETQARQKANAIIEALKKEGVKEADIQTTQFNLQPQWDWTETGQKFRGYQLYHTLQVTTKDVANTGKLIDDAVTAGANGIDSVQFTLSKEKRKDVFGEALTRAVEEAQSKATAMATTLNVRAGKPVQISEQNFGYQPPVMYAQEMAMMDSAAKSAPTPISPQEVEVTATVQVNFNLE